VYSFLTLLYNFFFVTEDVNILITRAVVISFFT
jgi:hypothetical protein